MSQISGAEQYKTGIQKKSVASYRVGSDANETETSAYSDARR